MDDVAILITGGTFDKVHDTTAEALVFPRDEQSQVPEVLSAGRCRFPRLQRVMMKDSLLFDDEDRDAIARAVRRAPEARIVITHGTGTMGDTARWLAATIDDKTVVLTGAMRPHSLGQSDAAFNLGGALAAAQTLAPGVYGVMNGRILAAADLQKNTETGRFDG